MAFENIMKKYINIDVPLDEIRKRVKLVSQEIETINTKNEKNKERYQEKKEQIKAYAKEKIICECGCITDKAHYNRHIKSKKHIKNVGK